MTTTEALGVVLLLSAERIWLADALGVCCTEELRMLEFTEQEQEHDEHDDPHTLVALADGEDTSGPG